MEDADTPLSPESVTQLRVQHRVRVAFLKEQNVFEDDAVLSRSDIREAMEELPRSERRTLIARTRRKLRRLNKLMDGTSKSFDAPKFDGTHESVTVPQVDYRTC
jgi:hypothetical protein